MQQPRFAAAFSTSFRAFEKQGTVDEELVAKLQSELEIETEVKGHEDYPLAIKEFLESSPFKVVDKPGEEEIELVRKFGDETIRVVFSIADLNAMASEEAMDDEALYDEQPEHDATPRASLQSSGAQSKAAKEDDRVAVADEAAQEDEYAEDEEPSFPARVNITIEKPNQGALQVDAIAQEGQIAIENVFYHKSAQMATAQTAEADWERRGMYAGPPFNNLDEDLQVLIERYLDERGIDTALALFVPDYIDYKEQKEYIAWLENVKGFFEA